MKKLLATAMIAAWCLGAPASAQEPPPLDAPPALEAPAAPEAPVAPVAPVAPEEPPTATVAPSAGEGTAAPAAGVPPAATEPVAAVVSDPTPLGLFSLSLLEFGGQVLLGVLLFLAGWIAAKLLSWLTYRALTRTTLDDRLAELLGLDMLLDKSDPDRLERISAAVVYYLLLLLVIVSVLQYLGLTQAAAPIAGFLGTVAQALPLVGKAVLLLGGAYVAGMILQTVVTRALDRAGVDARFAELSGPGAAGAEHAFSQTTGRVVFWLVMVVGLAGAFEALQIGPLADPLRNAMDRIIGVLPSVGVAALLLVAGWVFGRVARTVLTNLLDSLGLDRQVARARLDALFGGRRASEVAGIAAQGFILLQAVIAALNELGLDTLAAPLTAMMARFWLLLPDLAVSGLVLAAGVVLGRIARVAVEGLLKNIGFDRLLARLGLGRLSEDNPALDEPSEVAGLLVQVGIVLLAVQEVLVKLGFATWAGYVHTFLDYAVTNVLVALVIIAVGFAVANQVRGMIAASSDVDAETRRWIGEVARYAVLVFAFTAAIRHLEVAEDFVLLSFGLLFGALCLALALAFGLGSREVAQEIVRRQYRRAMKDGAAPEVPPEVP